MAGGDILRVIVSRNLGEHGDTQDTQGYQAALRHLHTVRLDREGITVLKNLEMVKEVQNLYLQENLIKKIENLDVLKNLRFLNLSWNRVEEIQKLRGLTNLKFLDLSHNLIKKLDASELPPSLLILDLTGNPCTKAKDYRQQVLEALPSLQQLDKELVRGSTNHNSLSDNEEEEEDGSSSDDSYETSLPLDDSGCLSSVMQEMIQRSFERRNRALREHEERLSELNDTLDKEPLILLRNDIGSVVRQDCSSTSLQKTACSTKPQNSIISEQKPQNHSAVVKKQSKEEQNNGSAKPTSKVNSKNHVSALSCMTGKSNIGLNGTSAKKLPLKSKINPTPSGQIDRKIISAPSTRKVCAVPTKNTLQSPEKTSTKYCPPTTSSRLVNDRLATSAPTKKTLQSPEKLPVSRPKVGSSAQGIKKKTL